MSDVKTPPTLLPNNNTESAPAIRKRHILILVFSVVLVIGLIFASVYQYRRRFDEFAKLRIEVETALASKNEPLLLKLAAHEFTVGQPELGNGVTVTPEKVIAKIISLTGGLKWTDHTEDFENLRVLYPAKGSLQLLFNHTPSGWIWSGVQSVSPDELAFLASENSGSAGTEDKVQYHEIVTEEAKGDEPSMDSH